MNQACNEAHRFPIVEIAEWVEASGVLADTLRAALEDDWVVNRDQEVAFYAAILSLNPHHVGTMVRAVPYLPSRMIGVDGGSYVGKSSWYDLVIGVADRVLAQLASFEPQVRTELAKILRPNESKFYAEYALALASWERGDYSDMLNRLDRAYDLSALASDETGLDYRAIHEIAAAAGVLSGDYDRAWDFYTMEGSAEDTVSDMIKAFQYVSEGSDPPTPLVARVSATDVPAVVLSIMSTEPDAPALFTDISPDSEGPEGVVMDMLRADLLVALARAGQASEPLTQWLASVVAERQQHPQIH